jgi:hypothetical protein
MHGEPMRKTLIQDTASFIIFEIMPRSTFMESKQVIPALDAKCRVSISSECGVKGI